MESFLKYIDEIYEERSGKIKREFPDLKIDKRFTIYEELLPIGEGIDFTVSFQLKKTKRTSLLLVKDVDGRKAKLYFSEFDIIATLIYIYDNYTFQGNYLCEQMCNLINDNGDFVEFKIKDKKFKFRGIEYINKDRNLLFTMTSDYDISINDFICLLNIVIEKDRISKKSNEGKGTILKYLLFIFLFSKQTSYKYKENLNKILKDIGLYMGENLEDYREVLDEIGYKKFYIDGSASKDILCYNDKEES